jgi:rare lipoprotein A
MSAANPFPGRFRPASILSCAWRATTGPMSLAAILLSVAGCVAVGSTDPRPWSVFAGVPQDLALAALVDSDDDRLTAPLTVMPPGAWPRVEEIPRWPNRPYVIGEERYVPTQQDVPMRETGIASWYGEPFHGRLTANGEVYDMHAMTAAHPTMPLPSYALVRHVASGREVLVRVNDRGPFVAGRVIDLSLAAAQRLGIDGISRVEVIRLTHDDIRNGRWHNPAVRLAAADTLPWR